MSRAPYLLGALLLAGAATAVLAPVSAAPDPDGGGLTCGLSTTSSPTSDDPRRQNGTVTGGPWTASQAAGPTRVSMRCSVQFVMPFQEPHDVFRMESQPAGSTTYLGPAPVSFTPPQQPGRVELCSAVTLYTDGQPPRTHEYDADGNPSNGIQCVVVPPGGLPGVITVYITTPRLDRETCAWVSPSPIPPLHPPYQEVCVPVVPTTTPTPPTPA